MVLCARLIAIGNGVLDGSGGGAGEFDEFIDGIFHVRFTSVEIS
jgi:hypothetical protein